MLTLSRRQLLVALATAAGMAGLCVMLAACSPSGKLQEADLVNTATIAATAMPTDQPTAPANSGAVATDSPPLAATPSATVMSTTASHPAPTSPAPTRTATEAPGPAPTDTSTATSPPAPTITSTSRPTATHPPTVTPGPAAQVGEAIIIDHTSTDIIAIPQARIEEAKRELHIAYGHTSHGRQVAEGMAGLVGFANNGGLGLALPQDIFTYSSGGSDETLDLREPFVGDAGYFPQWVNETTTYLGPPDPATGRGTNNPEINVVIWAWCGQVSGYTEQQMLDWYLLPMSQLEVDYPGITFVYMTGHADGTGEGGNLHVRNQQIRDYCIENDKVLYDFYDIELYDPDGSYYGDKAVTDNCDYDSDGDGARDRNWARDWQETHTQDVDWYEYECPHSQALNCNRKAYAAWALWTQLARKDDN